MPSIPCSTCAQGAERTGCSCGLHCITLLRRVLLIHWEIPAPLENFLAPADINWSMSQELGVDLHSAPAVSGGS